MERLVTLEDLAKYPELRLKGVSLNQHFDFFYLEQQQPPPLPQQSIQTPEGTVTTIHVPNNVHEHKAKAPVARPPVVPPTKKQEAKKEVKKEAPIKKAEVKKPVPVKSAKPVKEPAKKIAPVKKLVPKKTGKKGK